MNKRRPRSDDILFISALAALLLGIAFLLYTTGTFVDGPRAWPILAIAAGGIQLYFALARGASFSLFFGGLFFILEGAFFLVSMLVGWSLSKSWPLAMAIAGLAGFISGIAVKRRLLAFFAVPSISFALLGSIFAVFSFGFAKGNFRGFISVWWPTLLIAGGISLFVAYGLSRRAARRRAGDIDSRARARSVKPADSPGRDRGPFSGP